MDNPSEPLSDEAWRAKLAIAKLLGHNICIVCGEPLLEGNLWWHYTCVRDCMENVNTEQRDYLLYKSGRASINRMNARDYPAVDY